MTCKKLNPVLKQLSGGDLRSIGNADKVVKKVLKDTTMIDYVFEGLYSDDPVIRMRASDVLEKVSATIPKILNTYKKELIDEISKIDQQEVQWHLAQIYPRLSMTKREVKKTLVILKNWITNDDVKSKIVKTFSMQALSDLAEIDVTVKNEIVTIIKDAMSDGSPAMKARGKKLLEKL